jgi:putative oxidoreductase
LTRLVLGLVFVGTGWGKLHSLDDVTKFFASLGIPAASIQAPLIAGLEFVGGICLLIGLGTRVFAGLLGCTMIVAMLTALKDKIGGFGDLSGQMEFLYLLLFIWLTVAGAGLLSLDEVISRRWRRAAS